MKNSTSSTGIIWMLWPTVAWIHFNRAAAFGLICVASFCSSCCRPAAGAPSSVRRCARRFLNALDGHLQALALGRLQHVVDDALFEGLDRVLVVGGDEDDLAAGPAVRRVAGGPAARFGDRQLGDRARRLDAAHAGHPDVEEDEVRVQLLGQLDRLDAVLRLADDLEIGPDLAEARPQLVAQQAFVVGDDGARGAGESGMDGGRSGAGRSARRVALRGA
jgi:hypothetical protein